jgi:hypothetical protein
MPREFVKIRHLLFFPIVIAQLLRHFGAVHDLSCGSCSTRPGCGKICRNFRCADDTMRQWWSNTMARELVVP